MVRHLLRLFSSLVETEHGQSVYRWVNVLDTRGDGFDDVNGRYLTIAKPPTELSGGAAEQFTTGRFEGGVQSGWHQEFKVNKLR